MEVSMVSRYLPGLLLLVALAAAQGCAVNLPEYHERGYGIAIFPGDWKSVIWQRDGADGPGAKFTEVGGGYAAAVLEPGVYTLSGFYNVEKRSALGRGDKNLDFGGKKRGVSSVPAEMAGGFGAALVKRMPIKELRGGGPFDHEYAVDVSSEYRITLVLPESIGRAAWFEIGAGQVLLLPALRGEIKLDERSCARKGMVVISYTPHIFSYDPEDFDILEWYCPVDELVITLVPGRMDELKAAADPKKLPPELINGIEPGDLKMGPWLRSVLK